MGAELRTFWKQHGRPRSSPMTHIITHPAPAPGSLAAIRQLIRKITDEAVAAGQPRPLFPFEASDVVATYTYKKNEGDGLWFALSDGRVFNRNGEPDTKDLGAYDHG